MAVKWKAKDVTEAVDKAQTNLSPDGNEQLLQQLRDKAQQRATKQIRSS